MGGREARVRRDDDEPFLGGARARRARGVESVCVGAELRALTRDGGDAASAASRGPNRARRNTVAPRFPERLTRGPARRETPQRGVRAPPLTDMPAPRGGGCPPGEIPLPPSRQGDFFLFRG